jgi:hypothetical protein
MKGAPSSIGELLHYMQREKPVDFMEYIERVTIIWWGKRVKFFLTFREKHGATSWKYNERIAII